MKFILDKIVIFKICSSMLIFTLVFGVVLRLRLIKTKLGTV